MYNWVTTRKIERTTGPNYPTLAAQTVDAVVAKWIPATAALLACFVTPARATLDSRYYESPNYPVRAAQTVDATVRTWIPAFDNESASFRTPESDRLDTRRYDWDVSDTSWIFKNLPAAGPTVAQTAPIWANSDQYRTRANPPLDIRRYEWAPGEESWIESADVDAQVRTWIPAFDAALASGRTADRASLDTRRYDWDVSDTSWIFANLPAQGPTVAQTSPAWTNQDDQYRTAAAPPLDLFRTQSIPDIYGVPDDWITWVPIQDDGGLTRDRVRLDVRAYEWSQPAWIFTSLPTTFATVPQQVAVWADRGGRTSARQALDVRTYDWSPELGWIFAQLPLVPDATVAQRAAIWPTALTFRTRERGGDVRNVDTQPAFTWVQPVVDAAIAKLAPIFRAELASFRSPDDPRLDVRTYAWAPDPGGWIFAGFLPQFWPALQQNLGTEYQTAARAKLDVRAYDWQPAFTWPTKVVDAIVAKWLPVFDAEVSSRTIAARTLDVRSLTDQPEISWLFPVIPTQVTLTTVLHLDGSYRPIISVTGSYQFTVNLIGSYEPSIGLTGSVEPS